MIFYVMNQRKKNVLLIALRHKELKIKANRLIKVHKESWGNIPKFYEVFVFV